MMGLGYWHVSGNDEGGMEEGSHTGWVALGYVGDSAPHQPPVVSGGSHSFVAVTTPPPACREAVGRVCLCLEQSSQRGEPLAAGEGRGRGGRKVKSEHGWQPPASGRENLLRGTETGR